MNVLMRALAPRPLYFLAFLACLLAILSALGMQYLMDLEPCPLCIFQRVGVMVAGVIFLLAFLHGPGLTGRRIYAALAALATLAGGAVSIRHLWLQSLPPDKVPSCGPGLDYMLDAFPFSEVVSKVLHGSGECATVHGHFLGLTIPGWTLLVFAGLLVVALFQLFRPAS